MRVMVIVKATKNSEAGEMPGQALMATMGAFNQKLIEAGVMLDGGGLKPSRNAARVSLEGGAPSVAQGPFGQIGELASGYWLWKVESLDEAIEWAKQCPTSPAGPLQLEIPAVVRNGGFRLIFGRRARRYVASPCLMTRSYRLPRPVSTV